jgi:hypothetical protein
VVTALGLSTQQAAHTIRLGIGRSTTDTDITEAAASCRQRPVSRLRADPPTCRRLRRCLQKSARRTSRLGRPSGGGDHN